tara:strand:+ start:47 stop:283 length:237 start_codon:yes stop_codon:yes gene_type:complete
MDENTKESQESLRKVSSSRFTVLDWFSFDYQDFSNSTNLNKGFRIKRPTVFGKRTILKKRTIEREIDNAGGVRRRIRY